jgi:hypothetical protein
MSTATTTDLWTVTETRRRLTLAAKAARAFSTMGLGDNYKVEIGTRRLPVAYNHRPSAAEVWATENDGDDLADFIGPRDLKAKDRDSEHYAQVFTPGAVVHLYFTSPGEWGELVDVITVWLGYGDAEPEVVGGEADRKAEPETDKVAPAETGQVRYYSADELGILGEDLTDGDRDLAARYASRLIDRARRDGTIYDEPIPDAATAASAIADLVASDYPGLGAADTVCRENYYLALTGELEAEIRRIAELAEELEAKTAAGPTERAYPVVGRVGWGVLQDPGLFDGSAGFWVSMGLSYYGPFETLAEATADLAAEERAASKPTPTPTVPGDIEILTGFTAFAGGIVTEGDGVAVTFYSENLQPVFGWVSSVSHDRETATVEDVTFGAVTFTVSSAKTVAKIGRRQS